MLFLLSFILINYINLFLLYSEKNNKLDIEENSVCGAADWSIENRKKGLKYLNKATTEAQQEQYLKGLLANGTVPNAPKFWEGNANNNGTGNDGDRANESVIWGNKSNDNYYYTNNNNNNNNNSLLRSGSNMRNSRDDNNNNNNNYYNNSSYLVSPTEIMLHWSSIKNDSVSFYSLEFAGPTGTTTRFLKYKEIFRDPEDASPNSLFKYFRLINGLLPGTSYAFRIRSFNGFGPGEYTYKIFTTRPAAPNCPVILTLTSESVKLKWLFSVSYFRHINELKKLFLDVDVDNSGSVSREELLLVLNDINSHSKELKIFLNKIANKIGLDTNQGYESLFDMIEGDDDGTLTWNEFESFFMSIGWASNVNDDNNDTTNNNNNNNNNDNTNIRESITSLNSSISNIEKKKKMMEQQLAGLTYVIEKCQNEFLNEYEEVLRTNLGHGTIYRLEPGKSYRFRIYAINIDNIRGPPSDSIVVHTMLEIPLTPTIILKNVQSKKISISWKKRIQNGSNIKDKKTIQNMLSDWAGSHGEDDGGVSIETAFAKYDIDRSGTIDINEFDFLLKDLGIEPNEERKREAFALLDLDNNGVINFEEFGIWWRRDEVSYTIKRSDAILPQYLVDDRCDIRSSTLNIGLPRGDQSKSLLKIGTGAEVGSGTGAGTGTRPRSALRGSRESYDAENDNNSVHSVKSKSQGSVTSNRSKSVGRIRPKSATLSGRNNDVTNIPPGNGGIALLERRKMEKQVAMPIVCHRGPGTKCDIAGLEPNRL